MASGAFAFRVAGLPNVQLVGDNEFHNMQTHSPVVHAEYWIYVLAAFVIVVLGTLLSTVNGPIKFSSWFCPSLALASTSDDARIGLCSLVRPTLAPTRPDVGEHEIACRVRQCFLAEAR
jgi:hypothetical protein